MGLRINTNVASLSAQRNLSKATQDLSRSFGRLTEAGGPSDTGVPGGTADAARVVVPSFLLPKTERLLCPPTR